MNEILIILCLAVFALPSTLAIFFIAEELKGGRK
jgi:hypothetical protein